MHQKNVQTYYVEIFYSGIKDVNILCYTDFSDHIYMNYFILRSEAVEDSLQWSSFGRKYCTFFGGKRRSLPITIFLIRFFLYVIFY